MIVANELADWLMAQLDQEWPDATLAWHGDRDGNHDFRIRADGDYWLKLGHHIVRSGTNDAVARFLAAEDWVLRLQSDGCLFVGMVGNDPTLGPCLNQDARGTFVSILCPNPDLGGVEIPLYHL